MSRGITRSAPSDRSGSAALALSVGISLSMAVGGVFLMRTTNQSLKAVILAEKEAELINYAKKKAMLTGVTTPSPCATQTPLPSFTPDSDDPTQEWRCFTTPSGTGTETILQARKATAAAPDAPPPLVVTVTVPTTVATACSRQVQFDVSASGGFLKRFCIHDSGCGYPQKNQWVQLSATGVDWPYFYMWQLGFWGYIDAAGKFTKVTMWCLNGSCYPPPSENCYDYGPYLIGSGWIGHSPQISFPPPPP